MTAGSDARPMATLPQAVVGDGYTSEFGWALLTDLVDLDGRMAGHAGEYEAARLVEDAFVEAGLREVERPTFEIPGWWRNATDLTVRAGGRTHEFPGSHQAFALPGSPDGRPSGPLVDVGHGTPAEVAAAGDELAGAVALAASDVPDDADRWVHRTEKYGAAAEAGAVAFLFRNHVEGCLPPTGDVSGPDGAGPIPAVGVSREVGARLRRYCAAGEPTADLEVRCENRRATSSTVEGVVGPDTDEEVLVTAHLDAHDVAEGARDNGVGTAVVAEVGRLLAAAAEADRLETRVRCVAFGAEEVGLRGSEHWAREHELSDVRCVLNVDGAGFSRDLDVHTHGSADLTAAFDDAAADLDTPVPTVDDHRPHSDHWPFVYRGVPGAMIRTSHEDRGRGWGHTHADTLDKLDRRDLRAIAVVVAATAVRAAEADRTVARLDPDAVRDDLVDAGLETGLRAAGSWPFDDE
jgi:Zn-dependent M28 family amino/carboxypeptidase